MISQHLNSLYQLSQLTQNVYLITILPNSRKFVYIVILHEEFSLSMLCVLDIYGCCKEAAASEGVGAASTYCFQSQITHTLQQTLKESLCDQGRGTFCRV